MPNHHRPNHIIPLKSPPVTSDDYRTATIPFSDEDSCSPTREEYAPDEKKESTGELRISDLLIETHKVPGQLFNKRRASKGKLEIKDSITLQNQKGRLQVQLLRESNAYK